MLPLTLRALSLCRGAMPAGSWGILSDFFECQMETKRPAFVRPPDPSGWTSLDVDDDLARRLANTISCECLHEFDQRFRGRKPSAEERAQLEQACVDFGRALRALVADNDPRLAAAAVRVARSDYRCRLRTKVLSEKLRLVRAVSCALQRLATTFSDIAGGVTTIDHAMPSRQDMLPLACFCGTTLDECQQQWLGRGTVGYSAKRKALAVVRAMAAVLAGQAVEHMTPHHVRTYYGLLKGLHPNTAYGYLTTLTSLVKRQAPGDALRAIRELWPSHMQRAKLRVGRSALELGELGTFLAAVFNDRALKTQDRVIVALLALTGARLEEICMLRTDSLQWNGEYWTLSIELSNDEKGRLERIAADHGLLGNPKYKNLPTLRTVPVFADAVAGLHEHLVRLSSQPGFLFKQLSTAQSTGRRAGAFGQRVNRRVRELFGPEKSVVLESLRATVVTLLSDTSLSEDYVRAFVGHAPRDIHSEHYVKATPKKLLPTAREVRSLVLEALKGKNYMRLDVDYERWRRVMQRERNVLQVYVEPACVQQPPLDTGVPETVLPADMGLQSPLVEIADSALPTARAIDGHAPDLDQCSVHEKVGQQRSTARAGGLGLDRVRRLRHERHAVALEHPGNDQFAQAPHHAAQRSKPRRALRRPLAYFAKQSARTCSGRDGPFGAGPRLVEVELAAAGEKVVETLPMPLHLPRGAGKFEYPGEAPMLAQHIGPGAVDAPEVAGCLDPHFAEAAGVLFVTQPRRCAIGQATPPPEALRDRPVHTKRKGIVVGRAVRLGPSRERIDAQWPNERTPVVDGPTSILVRANPPTHRLPRDNSRQLNGEPDARHCIDQGFEWHRPVAAANAAGVTGQSVVKFLRHCSAAKRLERVPKRVEDYPPVIDATSLSGPQVPPPPFREVAASIAELVGYEVREEPFVAGRSSTGNVSAEPAGDDVGMDWHKAPRGRGLYTLPFPGIVDSEHQRTVRAVDNVIDPQLAQLLEACASGQAEDRQPGAGLAAPFSSPPLAGVEGGSEYRRELFWRELAARYRHDTGSRHSQAAGRIGGQPASVELRLQHRADESQFLSDGRWRKAVLQQ